MNSESQQTSMNQKIFTIGLSVEIVSLYILCCGLHDSDATISIRNLKPIWNGTEAALYGGLEELESLNIIRKILSGGDGDAVYRLENAKRWKPLHKS